MSEQSNQRMSFRESIGRDPNNPQGQHYLSEHQPGYQPSYPEEQQRTQPMTHKVQMMPKEDPVSGFAVTSMVLGILSVLAIFFGIIGVLLGLGGVIFGSLALRKVRREPLVRGKGMAIAGLVTGAIGFVVSLAITILAFVAVFDFYQEMENYDEPYIESEQDVYFDEDGFYLE